MSNRASIGVPSSRTAPPRSILCLIVACLAFSGFGVARSQEHNNSTDSLNDLNILFRAEYAEARQSQLADAGPVIIVRGDFLVLIRGENRDEGSRVHANYHDLKAVSHGPLALFCILGDCLDKPLDPEHAAKLQGLAKSLAAVEGDLEAVFAEPEQRSRQARILQGCVELIDAVLKAGMCGPDALDELVDSLRPLLVLNATEAARLRIDNYHAQIKRWRGELSAAQWKQLYVIIPGASLPRRNSLAVQYFAKLFQQEGEGGRVIYAEAQFDESQDLQLLGTHLLDSSIGRAFFDDSSRMKRDLLGPFANAYLDALDFEGLRDSTSAADPAAGN